jgi:MFS family permease
VKQREIGAWIGTLLAACCDPTSGAAFHGEMEYQGVGRIFDAWLNWPASARWTSGVCLIWILSALLPSFRERNPAGAFGENLLALGLYYGLMFGGIALGICIGAKIADRTGQAWLAWVVGVGLFVAAVFLRQPLGEFFGVSERLESLMNPDCYIEWDGRSNSSVCE